jgi:hypothetical protein
MIQNGNVIHDSEKKLDSGLLDSIQDLNNTSINFDDFFNKENLITIKHEKKNLLIYQQKIQLQKIFLNFEQNNDNKNL